VEVVAGQEVAGKELYVRVKKVIRAGMVPTELMALTAPTGRLRFMLAASLILELPALMAPMELTVQEAEVVVAPVEIASRQALEEAEAVAEAVAAPEVQEEAVEAALLAFICITMAQMVTSYNLT
jgi:hypothetical protein